VLEADEAAELLAHTGWQVMASGDANDPDADARRERLRAVGLLLASAGPATSDPAMVLHRGGYPDGS
jgi:hypothetical protein